eukprot:SM000034S12756  [mRNA]  locus=s34:507279:508227:- [translate_table: standard]
MLTLPWLAPQETRENDQPCFPCKGTGAQTCRFCLGKGSITVDLGDVEKETSTCVNCEGAGSITCTTCQGSGMQPRYLDRRSKFPRDGSQPVLRPVKWYQEDPHDTLVLHHAENSRTTTSCFLPRDAVRGIFLVRS